MSAILLATLATVMFLLASGLTFFADFPWLSHLLRGACTVLFPFLVVLLPREKEKPKKEGKKDLSLLFLVPAFVGITFGLSLLFQWIGGYFGITLPTYRGRLLFLLFSHALIPAVTEEFCFRGVVPTLLSPLGEKARIWGSAMLFALAHGSPIMVGYALLAGLFLGLVREYTGKPFLGMVFHFCNNAFCLVLMQHPKISPIWAMVTMTVIGIGFIIGLGLKKPILLRDFFAPLQKKKETRSYD